MEETNIAEKFYEHFVLVPNTNHSKDKQNYRPFRLPKKIVYYVMMTLGVQKSEMHPYQTNCTSLVLRALLAKKKKKKASPIVG